MESNVIQAKSFEFAKVIIAFYKQNFSLDNKVVLTQLLKSGTSIGANVEEAIGSQSRKEFFTKISIAYKETRESRYWINLIRETELIEGNIGSIKCKVDEICRILG